MSFGVTISGRLLWAGSVFFVVVRLVFVGHYCNERLDCFADFSGHLQQVCHAVCLGFAACCCSTQTYT